MSNYHNNLIKLVSFEVCFFWLCFIFGFRQLEIVNRPTNPFPHLFVCVSVQLAGVGGASEHGWAGQQEQQPAEEEAAMAQTGHPHHPADTGRHAHKHPGIHMHTHTHTPVKYLFMSMEFQFWHKILVWQKVSRFSSFFCFPHLSLFQHFANNRYLSYLHGNWAHTIYWGRQWKVKKSYQSRKALPLSDKCPFLDFQLISHLHNLK